MTGVIYGVRYAPDGKTYYVGQTVQKPEARWRQHRNANSRLGKLIKLFGDVGLFEMYILERVEDKDALNDRERHWIANLDTLHPNGLNQNSGGAGGKPSAAARQLASDRMREICADPEYKMKVSHIRKALWCDKDYRAKTLAGMAEAKRRPGYGRKIGVHTSARWEKPGHRELVAASTRAEWADPEKKAAKSAAISRAVQARWSDPVKSAETSAKLREAWVRRKSTDPEREAARAAALSKAAKARWRDPAKSAETSAKLREAWSRRKQRANQV